MVKVYIVCKERGVRFIFGENEGNVVSLLSGKKVQGRQNKYGKGHQATHTIIYLGANVGRLTVICISNYY